MTELISPVAGSYTYLFTTCMHQIAAFSSNFCTVNLTLKADLSNECAEHAETMQEDPTEFLLLSYFCVTFENNHSPPIQDTICYYSNYMKKTGLKVWRKREKDSPEDQSPVSTYAGQFTATCNSCSRESESPY